MSTINPIIGERPDEETKLEPAVGPIEAARARRLAALKAAEGLWKDRADLPKDGVKAQEQLRSEWR